ncbi:MAG TPA: magnesium transporter CorA family protein [Candidatus Paceibacterota bacterium]|jgi:magnesium transporter|nr:magnesium transporter CorA family protein [Candidatus Paceibacterota bacterium]
MPTQKNDHVEWIDIEKPTDRDISTLREKFGLHPVIVEELKTPSARARVERYDDYLYFIYYFPKYDADDESSVRTEIDFLVTKNLVATVHYEPITKALANFHVQDEATTYKLVYNIIEHLITFEERQLRHIREKVEQVGREIFKDKEKEVLERLTYLKRDVSEYRITVRLQEPILKSFAIKGKQFWGEEAEIYLNDLMGDHLKVTNQLEDYRDAISDFEDTNNQLMNMKINTVMKTFTSLSFLTFPFMLLAALFSMNTRGTPIVSLPGAFWIVFGIMIVGMITLATYFKRKRWF